MVTLVAILIILIVDLNAVSDYKKKQWKANDFEKSNYYY